MTVKFLKVLKLISVIEWGFDNFFFNKNQKTEPGKKEEIKNKI